MLAYGVSVTVVVVVVVLVRLLLLLFVMGPDQPDVDAPGDAMSSPATALWQ